MEKNQSRSLSTTTKYIKNPEKPVCQTPSCQTPSSKRRQSASFTDKGNNNRSEENPYFPKDNCEYESDYLDKRQIEHMRNEKQ